MSVGDWLLVFLAALVCFVIVVGLVQHREANLSWTRMRKHFGEVPGYVHGEVKSSIDGVFGDVVFDGVVNHCTVFSVSRGVLIRKHFLRSYEDIFIPADEMRVPRLEESNLKFEYSLSQRAVGLRKFASIPWSDTFPMPVDGE